MLLWTRKGLVGLTVSSEAASFFREIMSLAAGLRTWAGTLKPLLGEAAFSNPLHLVVGIQCMFTTNNCLSKKHADIFLRSLSFCFDLTQDRHRETRSTLAYFISNIGVFNPTLVTQSAMGEYVFSNSYGTWCLAYLINN